MKTALTNYIAPFIRHGLTVLSGVLVARGLPGLDEGTVANLTELTLGGAALLLGLGWSLIEKRFRK